MSDDYQRAIAALLHHKTVAFQASASDRGKLHQIELRASKGAPWIWAEMELISADVAGIATSCIKGQWRKDMTKEEAITILNEKSIFCFAHLVEWIGIHGSEHPDFLRYMLATEGLRLAAVSFLEQ